MVSNAQKYLEANYRLWNSRAQKHLQSAFYDMKAFRNGRTSLTQIELEALGDVAGKSMLHLQCHFGQDTLAWARLGANVTGIDMCEDAISIAQSLSKELNIPAKFICSELSELPQKLGGTFNIVFTSYGVIKWLPDIRRWAEVIHHFLEPGGTFFMVEFHPFLYILDDEKGQSISHSYFYTDEPRHYLEIGSYAVPDATAIHSAHAWSHTLGDIINALISSGLELEDFREYPYSTINCFPFTAEDGPGRYTHEKFPNMIPMLYSIRAMKSSV